ncbi:diacylglycerol kinase family protein [Mucilaginibacter agri]|uniref:Diacylglycerol kinase n=1 Tax=Mucilaginibacter agri TaxID=2695265 RepID=A0A965ZER6_9SPHI|nr:diacylglycerol kinase family protein [Mucilaginibacter agri]NCD68712.1 diacylglycerol kinase [Mucilaginibacter agri]
MKKLIRGFGYAFKGLAYAAQTQLNFRIHLGAMLIALALGFYLHISTAEWCWIVACIAAVLITELLNTAIEILVDLVSPEYNAKAGHIKDVSAAAVLITAIFAAIVGAIIFIPKF